MDLTSAGSGGHARPMPVAGGVLSVLGLFFGFMAGRVVAGAGRRRRRAELFATLTLSPLGEREGECVAMTGRAIPVGDEPLRDPIRDEVCLWYDVRVSEQVSRDGEVRWRRAAPLDREGHPALLVDGGQAVRVELGRHELTGELAEESWVGRSEELPERVRRYLDGRGVRHERLGPDPRLSIALRRALPEQRLTVVGRARRFAAGAGFREGPAPTLRFDAEGIEAIAAAPLEAIQSQARGQHVGGNVQALILGVLSLLLLASGAALLVASA